MPSNIGFFTAVEYGPEAKDYTQSILEKVDNYFYLGGKKACIVQEKTKNGQEKALLSDTTSSLSLVASFVKVLSYFTVVIPLGMLLAKTILRSTHTFRVIDPKKILEKGVNISEDTISKIQGLLPKILSNQQDDNIEWLSSGNNFVFKLKDNPH